MFKKISLCNIAILASLHLSSSITRAEDMTLSDVTGQVEQSSPKIQKSASKKTETYWKQIEASSGYLPKLSVSGSYLLGKNYMVVNVTGFPGPIAQVVPNSVVNFNLDWSIFDGFATTNMYSAAKLMSSATSHELDWTKFTVQRDLTLQFYKLLGAELLQKAAEENLKILEDHLKDVNYFKKAGVSTNYDVLRVEVQVSEAKSEVMNATDNVQINKNKLAEMLGKDIETRTPVGKLPDLKVDSIKNVDFSASADRNDILSLKEKTEAASYMSSAAGKYLIPKVSAFGIYQYYNNLNERFDDKYYYRDDYQVGLAFTWNLFDGMISISKSREAAEQKYQSEKSLQMAQLKARQDFEFWKRKYYYYCSVYQSRLSDVEKAHESVRLAKEGRRVGARTNTDLLDAENELYRAQAGAVNAQVGSVEALVNLELALGKKLYDFN